MALSLLPLVLALLSLLGLAQGCPGPESAYGIDFPEGFLRNDTALHRRWASIIPGDGSGAVPDTVNRNAKLWPGGLIRACIDPALSEPERATAEEAIRRGMEVWYKAGLYRSAFSVRILSTSECASAGVTGPRVDYVWVKWAGRTPAPANAWVPPSCSLGNMNTGSTMSYQNYGYFRHYTEAGNILARATNFELTHAHELGHLFGLVHEHQNPALWPVFLGGLDQQGGGTLSFTCQNVLDYDACLAERTAIDPANAQAIVDNSLCADYRESITEMCQGGAPAGGVYDPTRGDHFLSSREWLPYPGGNQYISYGVFDLQSIMVYDSRAGAKPGTNVYQIRSESPFFGKPGTVDGRYIRTGDPGIPGSTMNRPTNRDVYGAMMMSNAIKISDAPVPHFAAQSAWLRTWQGVRGNHAPSSCPI
ncbi:hypothetical protein V8F06_010074 [Rhypophila decipiens]